jgi:hypothetical protein
MKASDKIPLLPHHLSSTTPCSEDEDMNDMDMDDDHDDLNSGNLSDHEELFENAGDA